MDEDLSLSDQIAEVVRNIKAIEAALDRRAKALELAERELEERENDLITTTRGLERWMAQAIKRKNPCPDCGEVGGQRINDRCKRCYQRSYAAKKRAEKKKKPKTEPVKKKPKTTPQAQNGRSQNLPSPRERERLAAMRTRELIAAGKDRGTRRAEGMVDNR
ncbi:MAG: hypothetical protein OXM57_05705 [bacterium]|nr:hypothetical protein [bacterium]MDE0352165.1 hypothetical protein [bacterium]